MVTNPINPSAHPSPADLKLLKRSFRRAHLLRRYGRGGIKRSAMAMINYYMRQPARQLEPQGELHVVM